MSAIMETKRYSTPQIAMRKAGQPLVCLTAYTTPMARLLDPHVDLLLVGDSLGMVIYGLPTTIGVTLAMMIEHGKAVMRGSKRACVVVDMPFGSYQASPERAFVNAARVMMEVGCSAVKLEGGAEMAETVAYLTKRGIPVVGHIGLMPQSVNVAGGFKAQGKTAAEAERIVEDARAIAAAGAFCIVVEGTIETVAETITTTISVPTIGIGASAACDGQILVAEDILGLFTDFKPRFVKRYADLGASISIAVAEYAQSVIRREFPGPEHCFRALPIAVPASQAKAQ